MSKYGSRSYIQTHRSTCTGTTIPRVIIALKGGTMKIVEKSGRSEEHAWETGHAYWLPANPPDTQHADVNAGKDPIEVMVVELEKEH